MHTFTAMIISEEQYANYAPIIFGSAAEAVKILLLLCIMFLLIRQQKQLRRLEDKVSRLIVE